MPRNCSVVSGCGIQPFNSAVKRRRTALHGKVADKRQARSGCHDRVVTGDLRRCGTGRLCVEPVQHGLFKGCGARIGEPCQQAGIETKRDDGDACENRSAEELPDTLACAQEPLHAGEYLCADKQGDGERGSGTGSISKQQECRLQIGTLQRGTAIRATV